MINKKICIKYSIKAKEKNFFDQFLIYLALFCVNMILYNLRFEQNEYNKDKIKKLFSTVYLYHI